MKKRIIVIGLFLVFALAGCSMGNQSESKTKMPDTIRWYNATFAVITSRNGADIDLFGGYDAKDSSNVEMMKEGLKESWEVTDRKSAEETLKWALDGGHNKDLMKEYKKNKFKDYSRDELAKSLSDKSYTDIDRAYFLGMYDAVDKYGDNAILAWDLCRGMQLSAWYYIAGYYTYEEALDSCMKIASRLQKTYTSWDDMMNSYFYGFQYWNQDDMSDKSSESYARQEEYEKLKKQENGPYSLDWNLKLKKSW